MDAPVATSQPVVLAHESSFAIGPLQVRPETCELINGDRKLILEPRVMQVLVALHRAGGHVVSRDDLLARCWSGRIVGDDAIHRVISRLRHDAEAAGGHFRIETITRVGYRLIEEGRAAAADGVPYPVKSTGVDRRKLLAGSGAAALLVAAGFSVDRWRHPPLPGAAREKLEQGWEYWRLGTTDGFSAAQTAFKEAAELAPNHAEPWGALAVSYSYAARTGPPQMSAEMVRRTRSSMERALVINPDNADALTAGVALDMQQAGYPLADLDRRLMDLRKRFPDHAGIPQVHSYVLDQVGRVRASIEAFQHSIELDPDIAPITGAAYAYDLYKVGRTDEADQMLVQLLDRWSRHVPVWFTWIKILMYTGRYDRALAMLDDQARRPIGVPQWNFDLTRKQIMGLINPAAAPQAIAESIESSRKGTGFAENAILYCSAHKRLDDAFTIAFALLADRGYQISSQRFTPEQGHFDNRRRRTALLFEPVTAPMRADPRFAELTRINKLDDYWRETGTKPDYRA